MITLRGCIYPSGATGYSVELGDRWETTIAGVTRQGTAYVPNRGRKKFSTLKEAAIHELTLRMKQLKEDRIVTENVRLAIEEGRFCVLPPTEGGPR